MTVIVALLAAFAASPAFAAAPSVTIEDAKNVEYRTAEFEGTVDPGGYPTHWRFEYITDKQFNENVANSKPGFTEASVPLAGTSSSPETVGGFVEGLHAGTTYHLRLFAQSIHGSDVAVASNFTTLAVAAPVLSEVEASEVEYATATATGKVEIANSDAAFTATCQFEAATQQQWEAAGNQFPEGPFEHESEAPLVQGCHPPGEPFSGIEPAGPGTTEVEANFTGLKGGTEYHLRLVAQNQSAAPATAEGPTFETKPVAKAAITGPTASAVTPTSAHVSGTVAPNAPSPVTEAVKAGYNVHWFFTCTPECGSSDAGEVEAGQPATAVSSNLTLEPNRVYAVVLHAVNAGGDETAQTTVSTPAVAPDVAYRLAGPADHRTATSARLIGLVNPRNSALTGCKFEYGTSTSYGQTIPCSGNPVGNQFSQVSADVSGLQPGTTYHFRLVAADSTGSTNGADEVFTTFPAPASPGCGNEAIRAEQHAQLLPECRAWEMASPLDKNGAGIVTEASNVVAGDEGNAVEFISRAGFADQHGTGRTGFTQYIAQRGNAGWDTRSISPTPNPNAVQILFGGEEAGVFSEDLSTAVMWGYDLPDASDDMPHETNIYQQDTFTGALQTVTRADQLANPPFFPQYVNLDAVGASADAQVISFPSTAQLLPQATSGVENVYEWDHGALRVAGILPDGTVPASGSSLPASNAGFYRYRESVSSNGPRIAFLSEKEGKQQLYLRRAHTSTAWVSEAEGTAVTAAESVRLQWMSPDGEHLLFTTTSKLLPADDNETSDLYMYTDGPNPSSESNLELISTTFHAASRDSGVEGDVLGASDDGSRIYYLGESCGCGEWQLMYWDHGVNKEVADGINGLFSLGSVAYPGEARVSSDGLDLAFMSNNEVTSDTTNGHRQMYVYDATSGILTCASCLTSGPTETSVPNQPEATQQGVSKEMPQVRPRWLSDDGRKVFFTTTAALVPEDINGSEDVYVYDTETGQRHLVSNGRGEGAAWFESASADGSDVFFVTQEQLVGRDTDHLWDMYDARIGGGFPEPPPPPTPCSGDGCRGALSTGSAVSGPATNSFSGPGNPKHKKAHKHRKHRHHKKKHHKGKHHKSKRNSGAGK